MKVATVRVIRETEERAGWVFEIELDREGRSTAHRVRMGWADYDYWSHGTTGPSRVIEALIRYMADRGSVTLERPEFDAARARREHPEIDQLLPGML